MNKDFTTRDLYLASTLISLGFELINISYQIEGGDKGEKIVGYFNFEGGEDVKNAEKQYWSGKLAVEPKSFVTNLRGLRAQLANTYKGPNTNYNDFKKA